MGVPMSCNHQPPWTDEGTHDQEPEDDSRASRWIAFYLTAYFVVWVVCANLLYAIVLGHLQGKS
jgi:hypothetical protein